MRLDDLFDDAKKRVLARPDDLQARSALWQVFAARGEFERAHKQLDAMVSLDSSWAMEALSCQGLIKGEQERDKVFRGELPPVCVGSPPDWFAALVAALPMLAGQNAEAAALLVQAQQGSVVRAGKLNGIAFEWLCDGDARLGPCLELIVRGRYFWAPWSAVSRISSRPPTEIRDRLWLHAEIEFGDDGAVEGFLPARYPGAISDAHRLGETTDWTPLSDTAYLGMGQKTLITDQGECGLLDVRELQFS
ncbi:MAG: hypothetical protein IV093_17045 [Rubrivivax sp.]|nr:hypothetical protein [Rubrivivax sp.]